MRAVNQHHILRTVSFIIIFLISSSPFYFSFYLFFFFQKSKQPLLHTHNFIFTLLLTHTFLTSQVVLISLIGTTSKVTARVSFPGCCSEFQLLHGADNNQRNLVHCICLVKTRLLDLPDSYSLCFPSFSSKIWNYTSLDLREEKAK